MARILQFTTLFLLFLFGCDTKPPAVDMPNKRPLGRAIETFTATTRHTDQPSVPDGMEKGVDGDLTLREALALGLMHNPGLKSFAWEIRVAEAEALQNGLWSNPEVGAEWENFGGSGGVSGTRALETTLSMAQTFPLGGDIARRRELAGHLARLAGWDYEAARLALLTEITQRFVTVLAAQRRVANAGEIVQLAEQVRQTTAKRVEAGDTPEVELIRAGVPVVTTGVEWRRAQRALEAAKKQLALTWGQSTPTFDSVTGDLERMEAPPAPETLVALVNQNPEVARWATEISVRQAQERLAQAERVPDVTAGIGYRALNEGGDGALVAGISLPLPLFDRNQGSIEAARLGTSSARQRQREAQGRLETALSAAYARLADAYDEVVTLRDDALPLAREAYEVTRRAFDDGNLAFIDVIDAQRTLVLLRNQYIEGLSAYHAAAAAIEGLIGRPLNAIGANASN